MELTQLPGSMALSLMTHIAEWGNTTTIILHGGCVFEFKGAFPAGSLAEGYYNLNSNGQGFEGHIKLDTIDHIAFQSRSHRGKESHAFVFVDQQKNTIFKIFLGRDEAGKLIPQQVAAFINIKNGQLELTGETDEE